MALNAIHRCARLATWPWRRTRRALDRWERGHVYGWRQPSWWPANWSWSIGPIGPHDGKSVVIFVEGDRYEFVPITWARYRGHMCAGRLRPDPENLADRLARLNHPTSAARALAVISGFEGGFDSLQTYDRGKFSWGFIQFSATGGLPRLMQNVKAKAPDVFHACFASRGLDVDETRLTVRVGGRRLEGRAVHDRLHDDPSLWTGFLQASRLSEVQDLQVDAAYENYYALPLTQCVPLGQREVPLGTLFAADEFGKALVCDRAVHRGLAHTAGLFRAAAHQAAARGVEDAPAILACVRALEAEDAARLNTLEAKMAARRPGDSSQLPCGEPRAPEK